MMSCTNSLNLSSTIDFEGGDKKSSSDDGDINDLDKSDDSDIDDIDFKNFKGIYINEDPDKKGYIDKKTGCHF